MSSKINNFGDKASTSGPYDNECQARADVAGVMQQALDSTRRGALAEANLAHLTDACERAGVALGAYDTQILGWLANYEPQMCAVIVGLITRAYAAGTKANDANEPILDPYCEAGQHANCPGRLCQCLGCQHWRPAWPTA